ncbi:MAG: metallophosphoesterase [Clostridia bacterium]|nr:metallophosphoesterase [Clostridia bacterium]
MMRVLVLSDSHGDRWRLLKAVDAQPSAKYIIHLGDGARDMAGLENLPGRITLQVRGNCDFGSELPTFLQGKLNGVSYYACHGHMESVKYTDSVLWEKAREFGASLVLYGHTHRAVTEYRDGVWLMNPGSVHQGEYGVIDVTEQGVLPILMKIP